MIDEDGALALLAAVILRWWRDAHHDRGEVLAIANFLELSESELRQRMARQVRRERPMPVCRGCGAAITVWRCNGKPMTYCAACKEKSRA